MKHTAIKVYGDSWGHANRSKSINELSSLLERGWTVLRVDPLGDSLIYILEYTDETI